MKKRGNDLNILENRGSDNKGMKRRFLGSERGKNVAGVRNLVTATTFFVALITLILVVFSLVVVSSLILTGDTTYNSTNINITNRGNFARLNVSSTLPYNNLVAYYPFDGDSPFSKINPNGKVSRARDFDGVSDYVIMGDANSLDVVTNITVSAWVYRVGNVS